MLYLSTSNDGIKYDQYGSSGDIFSKSCNSIEIKYVNQSNSKARSGTCLFLKDARSSNILYCHFNINFGYSSILEIYTNSNMSYCNILNNSINNNQKNAVIRISFIELKISKCNIIHKIGDNVYYQPTDMGYERGSFFVSECYIPESNQWANNELVKNLPTYSPRNISIEIEIKAIECFSSCKLKYPAIYKRNAQNQICCMLKLKFPYIFQNLNCKIKLT